MKPYIDSLDFNPLNEHTTEKPTIPVKKDKDIITTKLVITMLLIAIVKIAVLMVWI
ncbi:MAG TPA: hypothetical protein VIP29_00705 [Nitrososphaeraceae archaeon]